MDASKEDNLCVIFKFCYPELISDQIAHFPIAIDKIDINALKKWWFERNGVYEQCIPNYEFSLNEEALLCHVVDKKLSKPTNGPLYTRKLLYKGPLSSYTVTKLQESLPYLLKSIIENKSTRDNFTQGFVGLTNAYPILSRTRQEEILAVAIKAVANMKMNYKCEDDSSNFGFLVTLEKTRDWRKDCCICLVQDIKGTTCGCGHTETTVFRPCGHSVCARPCFVGMLRHENKEIKPKTMKIGNAEFVVGEEINDDIDGLNIPCPLCRANIDASFRGENVSFQNDDIIHELVQEVMESLQSSGLDAL
jgi:hypothetical protein